MSRPTPPNDEQPLLDETPSPPKRTQEDIEKSIQKVRDELHGKRETALGHLIYEALDHASASISHPFDTLQATINFCNSKSREQWRAEALSVVANVRGWARANPIKVTLMVIGLGISVLKAKAMSHYMLYVAASFCAWSKRQSLFFRFCGFVALMSARLIVSTLVPPTSPGFGIIIQAATPNGQKWTAMPCFLLASAFAGAWPSLLDMIAKPFAKEDFGFTMLAKRFADNYPLTCWTGPAMREAFDRVYQSGGGDEEKSEDQRLKYGKLGASFAVIVGHVVPFMGAQTTIMQRNFLPHPIDTILSQPFGMTEDLVSMAMAEATSNPVLASSSLTVLLVSFNLARGLIFGDSPREDRFRRSAYQRMTSDFWATCCAGAPSLKDSSPRNVGDDTPTPSSLQHAVGQSSSGDAIPEEAAGVASKPTRKERPYDCAAIASACINVLVGVVVGFFVTRPLSIRVGFLVVACQMMVQWLVVPGLSGCITDKCCKTTGEPGSGQ